MLSEFYLNGEEPVPEDIKMVGNIIGRSTTCAPYMFIASWNDNFIYIHHKSHSSYIGRMTGSVNCKSFHMFLNRNNLPDKNLLTCPIVDPKKLPKGIALYKEGRLKFRDKEIIHQLTELRV